jgi:GcrA cell cycle regulator
MSDVLQTRPYGPQAGIPPHAGAQPQRETPDLGALCPALGGGSQAGARDSRAWSRERDAALIAMWTEQALSAAEIGRRLGISKNAVIGRSHRLRLPSRPSPIIRRNDIAKPSREPAAPARALEPAARPAAVEPLPVASPEPQERLRDSCRWPTGHPRTADFAFCGEPCSIGKPYCEEHCRRAYVRRSIVCTAETIARI